MATANDLLAQALLLARNEPSKPRQASLRRAVSTAYYALFHLLLDDASGRLSPAQPSGLKHVVRRAFSHGDMKSAARSFSAGQLQTQVAVLLAPNPPSNGLKHVARMFVKAQERRHAADYDLSVTFSRASVLTLIQQVQRAFADWKVERATTNANIFLTALLLHRHWSR